MVTSPARVHLLLGPVGAGKSTFARTLCEQHDAYPFYLDEWMADLFAPDRPPSDLVPWYTERAERCVDLIWKLSGRLLAAHTDVVLELGLIRRQPRRAFIARVESAGYPLRIYLVDAPREVRRRRVLARNDARGETFASVVPPEVFEMASDMWEPLAPAELRDRDVVTFDTGG